MGERGGGSWRLKNLSQRAAKHTTCIDLIFSSNVCLTIICGGEQSLFEKCHNNIMYGYVNFSIPLPPPCYREVWDFKNSKIEYIQKVTFTGQGLSIIRISTENVKL